MIFLGMEVTLNYLLLPTEISDMNTQATTLLGGHLLLYRKTQHIQLWNQFQNSHSLTCSPSFASVQCEILKTTTILSDRTSLLHATTTILNICQTLHDRTLILLSKLNQCNKCIQYIFTVL